MAGEQLVAASRSWVAGATRAGAVTHPSQLDAAAVEWFPAATSGTAAAVLRAAGRWSQTDTRDFDAEDWWWRGTVVVGDGNREWSLRSGGIATIADVWIDGRPVLHSSNMFLAHVASIGPLVAGEHEIAIRCAAIGPRLDERRARPRWRTRLVRHQNLRWIRTSLLGRIPGWSPTGAPVGPWRGVELVSGAVLSSRRVTAQLDGDDGLIDVDVVVRGVSGGEATIAAGGMTTTALAAPQGDAVRVRGEVRLPRVPRWWPHTHGAQPLFAVRLTIGQAEIDLGSVGFRAIDFDPADGNGVVVNGVNVFCRGAVWMPLDAASLDASTSDLRAAIDDVRAAGMNMIRIAGPTAPETDAFYDLCDEAGILVWHDLMLANMDPPDDAAFDAQIEAEVAQLLGRLGGRPSFAVLCGGSEVEQQASMLGLPRERWTTPFVHESVPKLVDALAPGVTYVAATPSGGVFPFHPNAGIAHYYGVGAYMRPLDDARRAAVRFAAESLAFSNVPERSFVDDELGGSFAAHSPGWKRTIPRESGAAWDHEDVRDHYVGAMFGVDADDLRYSDPERYLDLSRVATGELMAAVFAEWRRPASSCRGGLVWFLRDLEPGAGWGVVDSSGAPKPAWWYLRRALAPVGVYATDEGLNGLHLHVLNDTAAPLDAVFRVELFTRGELRTEVVEHAVDTSPHGAETIVGDALFEGFRDLTWAYRFGPAAHDVIAATLLDRASGSLLGRAVHLPCGLNRPVEPDVGLAAAADRDASGGWRVTVSAKRFAQAVQIDIDGYRPSDNWFALPPATAHVLELHPVGDTATPPRGEIRALNSVVACRVSV